MESFCDIVILAAGASSRLGRPKQLLVYKQVSLLQYSIEQALLSDAQNVIVVVSENRDIIPANLTDNKLAVVVNNQWQEGIASSIRCGLQYLLHQKKTIDGILFMVCDQPYVTTVLLNKLITLQKQTGNNIVASEYGGVKGIPAIFKAALFPELLQLAGDSGAKKIIMQYAGSMSSIPFPLGDIDIDTMFDYEKLKATDLESK